MKYFTFSEFDQKGIGGSGEIYMDRTFLSYLDALRHKCGFPLVVTSGYRTPEYNNKVSSTGLAGPHTTGKAADLAVSRGNADKMFEMVYDMGCFTGKGVNQKGEGRFIHLDILTEEDGFFPRPTIWSY